jgi:hypothetical protein
LTKALEILVRDAEKPVTIKTLDGTKLSWDFDFVTDSTRTINNPITGKYEKYKVYKKTNDPREKERVKRWKRHVGSFLPNLIHSIDGAIMRIFITKMYEKRKYIISHSHDSVLLHPNYVKTFYEIVAEVYKDEKMLSLADDLVFNVFQNHVGSDYKEKLEKIREEFHSYGDTLILDFNPLDMYKLKI